MKRIYTMFLLVLVGTAVYAQHPFIQQGKSWHVIGFNQKIYMNFPHLTAPDYEIDYSIPENSDTLIGGVKYKRLVGISEDTICSEKYIREDKGKVYCYNESNKREELLYDFTLQTGETFTLYPNTPHEFRCEVTSVGDSLYCGVKRKVICFDAFSKNGPSTPGIPQKWIEGIGYPGGPVEEVESDCYAAGIQQLTQFVTQEIGMEGISETVYASNFDTRYYYGRYYAGGKEKEIDYDDPAIWDDEEFWENYRKDDLHYEIVNHQLHIYGYIFCSCCPQYLYLTVDKNNEIRFHLTELTGILPDCAEQHEIDMYFPGFYEDEPYTVVNRNGERYIVEDSWRPEEIVSIWQEGTVWEVNYDPEPGVTDGKETKVIYRLLKADDAKYLALERTLVEDNIPGEPELQGYIRNDGDSMVYVRPILKDGIVGEECLLYDFRTPYEYGQSILYGVEGGEIRHEYIDWQKGSLEYYIINGQGERCLPAWQGILYHYGCLDGPMELFYKRSAPGKSTRPKPTNISHVIFSTKGGSQKVIASNRSSNSQNTVIPYSEMLTEGTVWECLAVPADNALDTHTYKVQVKGEVLIGDRTCKQIYSQEHDICLSMFEEGRKVYVINTDNKPEVLLNFGLQEQDMLDDVTCVSYIHTETYQGYNYRTITIDTGLDCTPHLAGDTLPWLYSLIEGVGVSKDEYLRAFLPDSNTVSYLLRCWKNGHHVYQVPGYEAVSVSPILSATTSILYDLQGRKVTNAPRKGLYIKDGRKVVR